MGGKHHCPVHIVQYNGYLIGKTDDDLIEIRKEKSGYRWNIEYRK